MGTLEFRSIIEPIRTAKKELAYIQANCLSVDPEKRSILCEDVYETMENGDKLNRRKFHVSYDKLVIAVGGVTNTFGIPGVNEYCYMLKDLSDARKIRQRLVECFERASNPTISKKERNRLLHFVIVGGGPTSVEFTAEIHDFLKQDIHKWFPELEPFVKVTLVEAADTLLTSFNRSLGEYTMRLFKKRAITVITGVSVKKVEPRFMILDDGTQFPYGMAMWSTGLSAHEFTKKLPFEKDHERIVVDEHLKVKGHNDIYALGDCSATSPNLLPQTAQVAQQQAKYLSKCLNQEAIGGKIKPFNYNHLVSLAYVGGYKGVVDSPEVNWRGFAAFLLWRGAYLTKLVSLKNKILVPMFWFKSFIFGRDISRF